MLTKQQQNELHYLGNRNTAGNCNAPPESHPHGQQTTDSACTHSPPDISVWGCTALDIYK